MTTPHDRLFANLVKSLERDLPGEPRTRVVNLAAIALGVWRSKSVQVGHIVNALPLDGRRESRTKRGQRWLRHPAVQVEVSQAPLARRLLRRLVQGSARISLILDRTEWGGFTVWSVSVGWRGWALPLVWAEVGDLLGNRGEVVQERLCLGVHIDPDKAAPGIDANLLEPVVHILDGLLQVKAVGHVLQRTVQVVGPPVIGAAQL